MRTACSMVGVRARTGIWRGGERRGQKRRRAAAVPRPTALTNPLKPRPTRTVDFVDNGDEALRVRVRYNGPNLLHAELQPLRGRHRYRYRDSARKTSHSWRAQSSAHSTQHCCTTYTRDVFVYAPRRDGNVLVSPFPPLPSLLPFPSFLSFLPFLPFQAHMWEYCWHSPVNVRVPGTNGRPRFSL